MKRPNFMDIMVQLDMIYDELEKANAPNPPLLISQKSQPNPPTIKSNPTPGRKTSLPPAWVPDEEATSCSNCQTNFTVFNRRVFI